MNYMCFMVPIVSIDAMNMFFQNLSHIFSAYYNIIITLESDI